MISNHFRAVATSLTMLTLPAVGNESVEAAEHQPKPAAQTQVERPQVEDHLKRLEGLASKVKKSLVNKDTAAMGNIESVLATTKRLLDKKAIHLVVANVILVVTEDALHGLNNAKPDTSTKNQMLLDAKKSLAIAGEGDPIKGALRFVKELEANGDTPALREMITKKD